MVRSQWVEIINFKVKMSMKITERDIEILEFINDFGFCGMPEIEKRFSIKRPLGYRLLRRLVREGYVSHKRLFYSGYGLYYLTGKGAHCTDLPPIERIAVGYYDHQVSLIHVYLGLRQRHPDATWTSERRLKHDKFYDGVGKHGHVADGILTLADGRKIAIEVELSVKGKNRVERILKNYGAQFSFSEVWYFCSPAVMKVLTPLVEKMSFIKIYSLSEFLSC